MFFAVFFGEFLRYFGVPASPIGGAIGMLIMAAITARVALGFMIFEIGVVSALALTIVFVQGSHGKLSLAPFSFPSATAGFNSISTAVIFGILSFIGYDYACVVAEETKTPRRLMPIAVILAAVTVGVFWMLGSYAYSESIPLSQLPGFISSGFTPITPIAKIYWGPGNILITITGLTASLGIYIVAVPATARILFAMGRDRSLPQSLGKLNARYQVPFNALTVVLTGGFASSLSPWRHDQSRRPVVLTTLTTSANTLALLLRLGHGWIGATRSRSRPSMGASGNWPPSPSGCSRNAVGW